MKKKLILFFLTALINISLICQIKNNNEITKYVNVLKKEGRDPIEFVNKKFGKYDLVIFDDALHLALEPFRFYEELIRTPDFNRQVKYVFIEVFSTSSQSLIDKYLNDPLKDSTILFKAFQDDFTGFGFRYETYFDLLSTIWEVNRSFANDNDKIKVIGVDMPISWCSINSKQDYEMFQKTLEARDYFMYKQILISLSEFNSGKKGIFLTNTRHAYKNIRTSKGSLYWNCTTFFNQMNPHKTYSIRFHNVVLSITYKTNISADKTIEGLEKFDYKWVRMENGVWDNAFRVYGNFPVAIPLKNNVFGKADYIGNHMLDVLSGQTMYDAYDAIVFLAPLENLHFSAMVDWIYNEDFNKELERRIIAVNDGNISYILKNSNSGDLKEYIINSTKYVPEQKNYFVESNENSK